MSDSQSPAPAPGTPALRVLAAPVAFNEEKKIGMVIDRFNRADVHELIVVDDCSTDHTADTVRSRGVQVVSHPRRMGVGNAIRTAIGFARTRGFDVLVILAGNDKDRPQEIPRLLRPIREEGCRLVQGSRYLPGGDFGNMPVYRRLATQFVHPLLFSLIAGQRITDSTNGFRAIRLDLLNDPRIQWEQDWLGNYELEPYLFYKAIRLGYKVREVPVSKIYPPHELGYTKMRPITGWWSILRPLIYLGLGLKK